MTHHRRAPPHFLPIKDRLPMIALEHFLRKITHNQNSNIMKAYTATELVDRLIAGNPKTTPSAIHGMYQGLKEAEVINTTTIGGTPVFLVHDEHPMWKLYTQNPVSNR